MSGLCTRGALFDVLFWVLSSSSMVGCASNTSQGPGAAAEAAQNAQENAGHSRRQDAGDSVADSETDSETDSLTAEELPQQVRGQVREVMAAGGYTYMRLDLDKPARELWVATTPVEVAQGDWVTVAKEILMKDFRSKTLSRTFKRILFGSLVGEVEHRTPPPHQEGLSL